MNQIPETDDRKDTCGWYWLSRFRSSSSPVAGAQDPLPGRRCRPESATVAGCLLPRAPARGRGQRYANIDTRPECVALRLNFATLRRGTGTTPNRSWTTGGVCNDTRERPPGDLRGDRRPPLEPGNRHQRLLDQDGVRRPQQRGLRAPRRHLVTAGTCTGTWIIGARTAYTPTLLTGNSAGDQCLRCHNDVTQYNGPRLRDTEETLLMGHKNMSRKVTVGQPWGGPPFSCSVNPVVNTTMELCAAALGTWQPDIYPGTDAGQTFDWINGTVSVSGVDKPLYWIYGDWLAALPRAVYGDKTRTSPRRPTPPRSATPAAAATPPAGRAMRR